MHLNECEISTSEVRGQRLVLIVGPRKVSADEGAALLSQFGATYAGVAPVYASPEGWQLLEEATPAVAPLPAASQEPAESPAPAAKKTRK